METEETPLVEQIKPHEAVYKRFSPAKKRAIVTIISWTGILPFFTSGSFIPSIPAIARDFGTTGSVISLAVSLSVFAVAVGSLFWAPYSKYYGRRPIFLSAIPLLIIGCIGVATSQNVPWLMALRFVQAFGASIGTSVGSAVISDIYKLEERGTAMGIFWAAILLGPALAPLAGGIAAQYSSWRVLQLALGIYGLLVWVLIALFLPETSHPGTRGKDLVNQKRESEGLPPRYGLIWINPVKSLTLLRSPNLLAVTLAGALVILTEYVLQLPIAYTIGRRFNIENDALIGLCFLPAGVGNMLGAPVGGWLSDKIVIHARQARKGVWVPEDRLKATLPGLLFIIPVSLVFTGFVVDYVDGTLGLTLALIGFFINGFGIDMAFGTLTSYSVDILHDHSAEVVAVSMACRSAFLACTTSMIIPLVNAIQLSGATSITAFLEFLSAIGICLTIKYGGRMRAWKDIGYSTAQNN